MRRWYCPISSSEWRLAYIQLNPDLGPNFPVCLMELSSAFALTFKETHRAVSPVRLRATHRAMTKPGCSPQTRQPQGLATLLVFDYPNSHLKRWYWPPSCRGTTG